MTYAASEDVLADRVRWAAALLAELLAEARVEGWLSGDSNGPALGSDELRARIHERLRAAKLDVAIAPMEWLRLRLELTEREADALWLLACVELDLGLARLAQTFGSSDCPDLSVQIWQRMTPPTDSELEHLTRLGLVETINEPNLPRHRRWVRAADRVS